MPGTAIDIAGGDAHKIVRVLRLASGDRIEVVDSAGSLFAAELTVDGTAVRATLLEPIDADERAESALQIDVAQAMPKGQKMDFIVEKAVELGAAALLPFHSERTIVHEAGGAKLERWRRLAKTAALQCGRRTIPAVRDPLPSFEALVAAFDRYDCVLFAWELAARVPLRERLPDLLARKERVLVVVGPEGGFTHAEAEAACARGAHPIWLGPRILRTETAALALLAVIDALVLSVPATELRTKASY